MSEKEERLWKWYKIGTSISMWIFFFMVVAMGIVDEKIDFVKIGILFLGVVVPHILIWKNKLKIGLLARTIFNLFAFFLSLLSFYYCFVLRTGLHEAYVWCALILLADQLWNIKFVSDRKFWCLLSKEPEAYFEDYLSEFETNRWARLSQQIGSILLTLCSIFYVISLKKESLYDFFQIAYVPKRGKNIFIVILIGIGVGLLNTFIPLTAGEDRAGYEEWQEESGEKRFTRVVVVIPAFLLLAFTLTPHLERQKEERTFLKREKITYDEVYKTEKKSVYRVKKAEVKGSSEKIIRIIFEETEGENDVDVDYDEALGCYFVKKSGSVLKKVKIRKEKEDFLVIFYDIM